MPSFGWLRQPIAKVETGPLTWIKSGFDKFRQLKSEEDKWSAGCEFKLAGAKNTVPNCLAVAAMIALVCFVPAPPL